MPLYWLHRHLRQHYEFSRRTCATNMETTQVATHKTMVDLMIILNYISPKHHCIYKLAWQIPKKEQKKERKKEREGIIGMQKIARTLGLTVAMFSLLGFGCWLAPKYATTTRDLRRRWIIGWFYVNCPISTCFCFS